MKLVIKKNVLNEKLNIVSKAISTKNIIPVLSGIKFDLKEEGLFLTTSNDDICIETFISKNEITEIHDTGSIVIPGRYFIEIMRKIEDNEVNIETDGLRIVISTKRGEYSLNGIDSREFPNIKLSTVDKPIILSESVLTTLVNQTCFAVSTQESRPILTGVNFKIEGDSLECNATDSYRLARKILKLDKEVSSNINIVVPGKNLIELVRLLGSDDKTIELHIFPNNITVKTDKMMFQSRLLNGSYPDTSRLIPEEFELTVSVDLNEFYNTIDRVSLLTDEKDKNLIKMEIVNNNMVLSSTSQEIGKIEENMSIEKDSDIDMKIAYSSKYMMEALRSLKCEKIEIKLNSEIKPIIIKNKAADNLIQLVLPIKTF